MAIELFYSNDIGVLFQQFGENIYQEKEIFKNPLMPTNVIAYNKPVKEWLRYEMARSAFGVCANFHFQYFEKFVWQLMQSNANSSQKLLSKENLQILIFKILLCDKAEELKIIRSYYEETKNAKRQNKKTWEISGVLASLLLEYEYQRADHIHNWLLDKNNFEKNEFETPQKYLYKKIFEPIKNGENEYQTMFKFFSIFEKNPISVTNLKPIHLFGISQISDLHQMIIKKISEFYQINMYVMNPCEEPWETLELKGKFNKKYLKSKPSDDFKLEEELRDAEHYDQNSLLSAWGKTGREYFRLMNTLTDYQNFSFYMEPKDSDSKENSVLKEIQDDILHMREPEKNKNMNQDVSLQILKAPTVFREVETVHQNLIWQLTTNADLKLHEIAIIVTNAEKYNGVIDAVFSTSNEKLSYHILDNQAKSNQNAFYELAILSLDFFQSNFNVNIGVNILESKLIKRRFAVTDETLQIWKNWLFELKVYHFYDSSDRDNNGFVASEFFTWKQALKQLRMGYFYSDKKNKDDLSSILDVKPFRVEENQYPVLDSLIYIFEFYFNAYRSYQSKRKTCFYWVQFFKDLFEVFGDSSIDSEWQLQKAMFFEKINEFKIESSGYDNMAQVEIPEYVLKSFFEKCEFEKSSNSSNLISGGVAIGGFEAFRPFNYKIVYILGLDSKSFPAEDRANKLDLRKIKRRVGDISNYDRSIYNFLEKLSFTKEKLILSWVHKDLKKDEDIDPSSVISILTDYLNQNILATPYKFIEIPYWGYEALCLDAEPYSELHHKFSEKDLIFFEAYNEKKEETKKLAEHKHSDQKEYDYDLSEMYTFLKSPLVYFVNRNYGFMRDDEMGDLRDNESPDFEKYECSNLAEPIFCDYCESLRSDRSLDSRVFFDDYIEQLLFEKRIGHEFFLPYMKTNLMNEFNAYLANESQISCILEADQFYSSIFIGHTFSRKTNKSVLYTPTIKIDFEQFSVNLKGSVERVAVYENEKRLKVVINLDPKVKFFGTFHLIKAMILLFSERFDCYEYIELISPKNEVIVKCEKEKIKGYLEKVFSRMAKNSEIEPLDINSIWGQKKIPDEPKAFYDYAKSKSESRYEVEKELVYSIKNLKDLDLYELSEDCFFYYKDIYSFLAGLVHDNDD